MTAEWGYGKTEAPSGAESLPRKRGGTGDYKGAALIVIFMAKRTTKKVEDDTINEIVSRKLEKVVAEIGITIENSSYVHGEYDWVITFTAEDIRQAKKFSDTFVAMHPGYIEKVTIMQTLMCIKKQYVLNPEKMKLKEFL